MPHILFLTEKWCDGDPSGGSTNSQHNLFGSLEASGLASFECIHFDEFFRSHGVRADEAILTRLRNGRLRPDLVIATPLWGSDMTPAFDTYARIFGMGIPLVFIIFDASDDATRAAIQDLSRLSVATVVFDLTTHELFRNPRFVPLWTPQDPRIFHDANQKRTIDVSFAGSVGNYPDRQYALERIRKAGIDVLQSGGQREQKLSIEDYASIHQKSRIALNFSKAVSQRGYQAKGRVFEVTLAGALLLEEDNVHIKRWFEPGEDYVPFLGEDDLIDKIKYYLHHEDEREGIARNGRNKALRFYNERRFWGRVLELAGVGWRAWWPARVARKVRDQPLHRLPVRAWRKACSLVA